MGKNSARLLREQFLKDGYEVIKLEFSPIIWAFL
jgi:hypothetical protein